MRQNIFIATLFCLSACHSSLLYEQDSSYLQWRKEYRQDVMGENGWLSLVGLYWLKAGVNTLGSCKNNQHRLPAKAPCELGQIDMVQDKIHFLAKIPVLIDGKMATESELKIKPATQVEFGEFSFFIIKREKGYALRLKDRNSPYLSSIEALNFYPYQSDYRVNATLHRPKQERHIKIATFYGTIREVKVAGTLSFELDGQTLNLLAVDYGKDNPMGIMFADATNQDTTYGAGRYVDVPWPVNGEQTVLDFNRAYNPPCAYTNFATCPLPPPENRLGVAIEAGEQYPPLKK